MSYWTYIHGIIAVRPLGSTQPQKRYVLETVLAHLPAVTGSEKNMKVHVVQKYGHSGSSSCNEFDEPMWYRRDADNGGRLRTQDTYFLVLEASLRDRMFEDTLQELNRWLNRLAKRVSVEDILVKLTGRSGRDYCSKQLLIHDSEPYRQMEEWPSWCEDKSGGEPCWAEYLLYETAKDSRYPMKLMYKYYNDEENDAEYERRQQYERED